MICTAIGDSIAVGYGDVANCVIRARVGAPSGEIAKSAKGSGFCVISSGSNDPDNPSLEANLIATRKKVESCADVVWILPANKKAANVVRRVARSFGDSFVAFRPGKDGVHPKSYVALYRDISSAQGVGQ